MNLEHLLEVRWLPDPIPLTAEDRAMLVEHWLVSRGFSRVGAWVAAALGFTDSPAGLERAALCEARLAALGYDPARDDVLTQAATTVLLRNRMVGRAYARMQAGLPYDPAQDTGGFRL